MTGDGPRPGTELLAVDLGLRTGLAQYGADGRLRAYRSKHFGSIRELRRGVHTILREDPVPGWVWVEGGGELADVWERQAQHDGIEFRQVHATDWRTRLLLPRHRTSGPEAKRHAGRLARSVIDWSGARRPKGGLRHDAAEAILLGLYAVLEMGWLPRLPDMH